MNAIRHPRSHDAPRGAPSAAPAATLAIYAVFFLMGLWGCLSIYNSAPYAENQIPFASKQLLWLALGLGVAIASAQVPFHWYERLTVPTALAAYASLLLVLRFGVEQHGMRGWFHLKYCFAQPSELAKPIFILALSVLAKRWNSPKNLFPVLAAFTLLWILPLAAQPDFGTMTVYLCGFVLVYLLSNGSFAHLALAIPLMAIGMAAVYFKEPYVAERINAFFASSQHHMAGNWHSTQFARALAGGGFSGSDWGRTVWSNNYLPLAHSDSSFAALVETVGFAGALPVIAGFCALAYAGYRISRGFEKQPRGVFIRAVSMLIAVQGLIHISVNVGLIPPTGITLPMLSYGGSSMISTALCLGMVVSAARADSGSNSNHISETQPAPGDP